ncbi:hypothetical protein EOA27_05670 [Mesorhizobium sp. M2A.F.Ca.ET.037.01.1.1]|uniref:hypothetical protein n=1 Tax=unclassified Mesorhizobium TaxID=325217 RepID=UPI000FCC3E68|nr:MULTISPECIES: hypothetical protein [unclassified Mesorhizobium]RUX21595.1 hypothetical protein EOA27_05670 [Mesorhizobium sp. M2A.F.Ca.ET.037.01.1.1]RUY12062.1 hypothetical protein EOA25_04360 [Mesorhizobium sp. M2A.F.Ca.ET.040.01.1.1]RWA91644.1 MAG: hypothetical protein EOQ31_11055 [Mesorhizobium sp.]TIV14498.1 MAG: hypothetical protein E5V95_30115 [Mesorhizobium sp.]
MNQLSELNLDDDFKEAIAADDATRWHLDRKAGLEVWVTLAPAGHEEESFTARLLWQVYPGDLPPSVLFVDPATGRLGVAGAWPTGSGFRPPNDICATWTLEGYLTHPEWKTDPTKRLVIRGNALLLIVRTLQHELDINFAGRCRP